MDDIDHGAMQDGLLSALNIELEYMSTLHPIRQPGLWLEAVENVRALKQASDVLLNQQVRRATHLEVDDGR